MDIIIRKETEYDYYASELLTMHAFWNKHRPGCDEHYLVHLLRDDETYIPELSYIAEYEGKVIGLIMYAKAVLKTENGKTDIITFGPLCVEPEYQKKGVGGKLLEYSLGKARELGYRGAVIFGEPDYYPLHGFSTCDKWGITTDDGKNFDAFMGIELTENGFAGLSGAKFIEPAVYSELPPAEVEEYNLRFPYMEKKRLPGQWAD